MGISGRADGRYRPGWCAPTTADRAVRAGQIHVIEDTALGRRGWQSEWSDAVGVDGQELAGFDVADERRADDVERAVSDATTQP